MSSGVITFLVIATVFAVLFLLTNTSVFTNWTRGRTRSLVPGLKRYVSGPRYGTYSIKFYPDREALTFKSTLQGGGQTSEDIAYGWAKIVVFFTSFELFYYGNGSAAQDTSGPLREQLRRILNSPEEPMWPIVEWDLYEHPALRYDGELYRNALSVPSVLGVDLHAKDVSLVQGVKALVGHMLHPVPSPTRSQGGAQSQLVRHAVTQLLDWHEQFGPARDTAEAQYRGASAWEAALASVRGVAV